jgi:hypothetical protein
MIKFIASVFTSKPFQLQLEAPREIETVVVERQSNISVSRVHLGWSGSISVTGTLNGRDVTLSAGKATASQYSRSFLGINDQLRNELQLEFVRAGVASNDQDVKQFSEKLSSKMLKEAKCAADSEIAKIKQLQKVLAQKQKALKVRFLKKEVAEVSEAPKNMISADNLLATIQDETENLKTRLDAAISLAKTNHKDFKKTASLTLLGLINSSMDTEMSNTIIDICTDLA